VFATGGNPQAARAQGINVNRVKETNFMISGTLAAFAGIMEAARFSVVEPLRGTGYELDVIAATVIGGTLLTGGYGSIFGTVLGILIAFMLKTGLVLIGVQADWFRGVLGIIMIVAVVINTNIRRQR
jgi:simple sugar transport system permease protein